MTAILIAGISLVRIAPSATPILIATLLFATLGLVDDVRRLSATYRLPIQFLISGAVTAVLVLSSATLPLHRPVTIGLFLLVGTCWIPSFVNAFNFMDGINGISAAQAIVAGTSWAIAGHLSGNQLLLTAGATVAAAMLGFAPFNFPRARMFSGDVGSYGVGAFLASTALYGVISGATPVTMMIAPLAIYLSDTSAVIAKRLRAGEPLFVAHRKHVYQRLVIAGWSHSRTTMVVGSLIALTSVGGLASFAGAEARAFGLAAVVMIVVVYLALPTAVARPISKEATIENPESV